MPIALALDNVVLSASLMAESIPGEPAVMSLMNGTDGFASSCPRPFSIGSIEPMRRSSREERRRAAEAAGWNVALLDPRAITVDLHSDSATAPPLARQTAAALAGPHCADDPVSRAELKREIASLTGKTQVVLFAQGRAAEAALCDALPLNGTVAAANCIFPSTRFHLQRRDCHVEECPAPGLLDLETGDPFLGNPNLGRVRDVLYDPTVDATSVWLELACNGAFGQPVSLGGIERVGALAGHLGAKLYVDATRALENAVLVRRREERASRLPVRDLVRELLKGAHAVTASCLKSFHSQVGGFVATDDEELATQLEDLSLARGDGLAGPACQMLLEGVRVASTDEFAEDRCLQAARLHQRLACAGLPVRWPEAAHAVFLDALAFLPQLRRDQHAAKALALALYLKSGIRIDEHFLPAALQAAGRSYVRIAIPARRYLDDQIDWVADELAALFRSPLQIAALEQLPGKPGLAASMCPRFSMNSAAVSS